MMLDHNRWNNLVGWKEMGMVRRILNVDAKDRVIKFLVQVFVMIDEPFVIISDSRGILPLPRNEYAFMNFHDRVRWERGLMN